ncbi:LPS export ABC transporter permease LptG [Blastomonas sp. AAP53]|uniref:LPS export ABC transporter permease LptG n=1 Tax=Blastomonas sp. AAP53 TaxID=1248760 RepID=UPI000304F489|nr:LPS export ABC transporter permease LptG [Blastomonas sp. AAP53]
MQMEFFPSRTVAIYMARKFLTSILAVAALLFIVLQSLDLLGQSGKIMAYPGNGQAQLLTYISLRAPQIIDLVLPFSVLLATIITLATLNQNSEVVAMKAAGLSAHQVLAPLLIAAFGVSAITFVFSERILTRATATLSAWEQADFGPIPRDSNVKANIWVREGDNIIQADMVEGTGKATRLTGVAVFARDSQGGIARIIRARNGTFTGQGWKLTEASRFDVATGQKQMLGDIVAAKGVRPDQFTLSKVNPEGLSFLQLWQAIEELKAAGRPTASLESNLWHKLSGPLSALLMPLLGAVAAFGLARSGQLFLRAVIGMGLGFAYFVADNFALAMGNLGAYPPVLAAWSPFFLFLMVGETVLIRTEE